MKYPNKFMIEGLDRLGKDTLIKGIMNQLGFYQVIHFSKPQVLDFYKREGVMAGAKMVAHLGYQMSSFENMMALVGAPDVKIIFNRAHLGEAVYAPLYRGYNGDYVFHLENINQINLQSDLRLILLSEDFKTSKHFVDDGESFDVNKRAEEQDLFVSAFNTSTISDKRIICVTDPTTGSFRPTADILKEALQEQQPC